MRKQSIFLPHDRPENPVDKLQAKITEHQRQCRHNFKFLRDRDIPPLETSLVEEVFIGEDKYQNVIRLELQCTKCSLQSRVLVNVNCPRCLEQLEKDKLEKREKYRGKTRLHYSSRVYTCKRCKLSLVVDEWNRSG